MQVLGIIFIVFSVTCASAKPYEYSYYISTPEHFQSLAVRDGAAIVNGFNPNIRQSRGPEFIPNNPLDRRYPLNGPDFRGVMDEQDPTLRQGRVRPGFIPNERYPLNSPDFRRRMDGEFGPQFNPNERYPVYEPDLRRGTDEEYDGFNPSNIPNRRYPDFRSRSEDIPDGGLDPLFNQGDQRRQFSNSAQYPRFNQIGSYSLNQNSPDFDETYPEFGRRIRPLMPQHTGISRRASAPEKNKDREEVTTSIPCTFCGIDKVNGRDGINETDPDSETVEPRNGLVQSNAVTPANVVLPFNPPVFPYYVVA
ncbi:unnamed protein product [Ceutorhynchus assimilis]|uniref:Uncharacterized protein n=1 Tax=Ceutorhynchus assimilis TaxID=467358 RepID=A0A9N9MSN3_9CUCU|nr:unnamed protein product [Ceutorhynchus assimilis]